MSLGRIMRALRRPASLPLIALAYVALLIGAALLGSVHAIDDASAQGTRLNLGQPLGGEAGRVVAYPRVCQVNYALAAGERRVMHCEPNPGLATTAFVQILTQHSAVDASLIVTPTSTFGAAFSLSNRSDRAVTGSALVQFF